MEQHPEETHGQDVPPAEEMHGGDVAPATEAPRRPRTLRLGLAVAALGLLLPLLLYFARTEAVSGHFLDLKLEALAQRTGVRVARTGDVEPVGFSGVAVRGILVRRPDEGGSLWLAVERVEVFPDPVALLMGDLNPALVRMDGVEINLKGRDDLELLQHLRQPTSSEPGAATRRAPTRRIPAMALSRVKVRVDPQDARLEALAFESGQIALTPQTHGGVVAVHATGDIALEGFEVGRLEAELLMPERQGRVDVHWERPHNLSRFAAPFLDDPRVRGARIMARGVGVSWPLAATLHDARVEQIDITLPWSVADPAGEPAGQTHVVGVEASELTVAREEGRLRLMARDAVALARIPTHGESPIPLGHAHLEWDRVRDQASLGVDFQGELGLGNASASWRGADGHLSLSARVAGLPLDPYGPLLPHNVARHARLSSGVLSGSVVIEADILDQRFSVHTDLELNRGNLQVPVLASEPIEGVELGALINLEIDRPARRVSLSGGVLRAGSLRVMVSGEVEKLEDGHWTLAASASVPRVPAQDALESIPAPLVPMLQGYRLDGEVAATVSARIDSRDPDATVLDVNIDADTVRVAQPGPNSPIPMLTGEFSLRARTLPGNRRVGPSAEGWVSLAELPGVVPQAITSAEDGAFWKHEGFDIRGIRAALIKNVRAGRLVAGGSTISQQVIKNLFLSHDRTLGRKLQEMLLTWHLEQIVSKERILEIYLNILHLGPEIYGIRHASRVLFRKHPDRLSLREAVFLGSILPNPDLFIRLYAQRSIPEDRRTKMRHILTNMMFSGFITERVCEKASLLTDQGVISIAAPPRGKDLGDPG